MNNNHSFNISSIDTAVHGPVRLSVLAALQAERALDFSTLKQRLGVTDGVLGTHLQKLEAIGYVTCKKSFVGRRPKSTYKMTTIGRKALFNYLEIMQNLIDALSTTTELKPKINE